MFPSYVDNFSNVVLTGVERVVNQFNSLAFSLVKSMEQITADDQMACNCKLLYIALQRAGATNTKSRLLLKPLPTQTCFGLIN